MQVVEELANQLLALQARVQALERRLPPGAGSSINGAPATAFATSAASLPAADALWQELQTLGERLLRLEGSVGMGLGRSSTRALLQDRAVGASSGSAVITVIEEHVESGNAGEFVERAVAVGPFMVVKSASWGGLYRLPHVPWTHVVTPFFDELARVCRRWIGARRPAGGR